MERELAEKYNILRKQMESYASESIAVAFSGGVDSALVLKLACMAAGKRSAVYAVTVQTKLHPKGDLEEAGVMAGEFGAVHKVLQMDELAEIGITENPPNRCYLCKRGIFRKIKELAEILGAECVMEGTNADDLLQYRPGIQALKELGIISPLAACGFTKAEIRKLAEYLNIRAADRPSAPCLATRLPYGAELSYELLAKIDAGEQWLRGLGFYNVRLRVQESMNEIKREKERLVRIEVDEKDLSGLLEYRKELVVKLKALGFHRITVDLEGFRSGSMDL